MKLTRGQKNELKRIEWEKRKQEIEQKTRKQIIQKTKAGVNSTWGFTPGGEGIGFESPENVVIYLENQLLKDPNYLLNN